jgi:UDP-N-acetyl-2-amino-2-deoxyglucuronate dehydrogenase
MTIHVGLIGGGNITETHARAATAIPDLKIAAMFGSNSEKVLRLSQQYGGTPYSDFERFLDHRPMHLVALGSPSGLHAAHGVAAASRGLHVLTEKPLEISTASADHLISAAQQHKVKLGVIFQDRLKPEIRRLKEWIERGVLGRPLLVDARVKWYRAPEYYSQSKWRGTLALDGGAALINQAIHTVDLLLWLMGDVKRVQSCTSTLFHAIEGEDLATAILQFESGAIGTLQASTAIYPGYARRLEITGSEGTVILEHDRIIAADLRSAPDDVRPGTPSADSENVSSPLLSDFSGHQAIFEDFVRAINQDGTPACDGQEGRRSLALVEGIYEAAGRKQREPM